MDNDITPLILKWSGVGCLIGGIFFVIGYVKSGEIFTAFFAGLLSLFLLISYPFFWQGYLGLTKKETVVMGRYLGSAIGKPIIGKNAQIVGVIYVMAGLVQSFFTIIIILSLLGFLR